MWLIKLIWFPVVDWVQLVDWMCGCLFGVKFSVDMRVSLIVDGEFLWVCECLIGGCRCSVESGVSDSQFGK
jgi:hypothetical protein